MKMKQMICWVTNDERKEILKSDIKNIIFTSNYIDFIDYLKDSLDHYGVLSLYNLFENKDNFIEFSKNFPSIIFRVLNNDDFVIDDISVLTDGNFRYIFTNIKDLVYLSMSLRV